MSKEWTVVGEYSGDRWFGNTVQRFEVPGGWIYMVGTKDPVFVPNPRYYSDYIPPSPNNDRGPG